MWPLWPRVHVHLIHQKSTVWHNLTLCRWKWYEVRKMVKLSAWNLCLIFTSLDAIVNLEFVVPDETQYVEFSVYPRISNISTKSWIFHKFVTGSAEKWSDVRLGLFKMKSQWKVVEPILVTKQLEVWNWELNLSETTHHLLSTDMTKTQEMLGSAVSERLTAASEIISEIFFFFFESSELPPQMQIPYR